ncbi:hypothetical protein [Teredinibacter turnerae]
MLGYKQLKLFLRNSSTKKGGAIASFVTINPDTVL